MMKKKILRICSLLLLCLFCIVTAVRSNVKIDEIKTDNITDSFSIVNDNNFIAFQEGNECSAYASAYVMRHFGEKISAEEIYPMIDRTFGFVFPQSVTKLFWEKGYNSKTYSGNIDSLKRRVSDGIPVIAFINIEHDTHYVVVVGYDEEYIYLVDSILENSNMDNSYYNRKVTNDEFKQLWKTNTILQDNVYIVVN